jgi:hypothetical protein
MMKITTRSSISVKAGRVMRDWLSWLHTWDVRAGARAANHHRERAKGRSVGHNQTERLFEWARTTKPDSKNHLGATLRWDLDRPLSLLTEALHFSSAEVPINSDHRQCSVS